MNLNDLANLGQIIGAGAVVVSLIYVAWAARSSGKNAVTSSARNSVATWKTT